MKKQAVISSRPVRSIERFTLESLGCAKNQVDAEVIINSLEEAGYLYVEAKEQADLILVNTCGFIQSAKEEAIQVFLEIRDAYPEAYVVMTGCMAQRYGEELKQLLPEVDGVFGNRNLGSLSEWISSIQDRRAPVVRPVNYNEYGERKRLLGFPGSAYVKIGEGCSNRCRFCAIPLIRGEFRSRPEEEILGDIRQQLQAGVKEINLIAQDLANYGIDWGRRAFVDLCRHILEIPGDYWVRMLYIHPDHFPEEILDLCEQDSRLLPYFDIPFQHASRRVLKKMGRRGDAPAYLQLIQKIRSRLPDAVIRSTFMVGFPGEGKKDIDQLKQFQDNAGLDWVGFFTYSREEDTPAFRDRGWLGDRLSRKGAAKVKGELEERQHSLTEQQISRFLGKTLFALVEESVEGEDLYLGRVFLQAPEVDGLTVIHSEEALTPGAMVKVRIIDRNGVDFEAHPVESD